jgi:hypothetical protein
MLWNVHPFVELEQAIVGVGVVPLISQNCSPAMHIFGTALLLDGGVPGVAAPPESGAVAGCVSVKRDPWFGPPAVRHTVSDIAPAENGQLTMISPDVIVAGPSVIDTMVPG